MAIRIVIADDDPDFLEVATIWLTRRGASVRACMDARSCIGMFEEELPDVAIVDGILPGTDDLWLVEHLRRTFPSAPLIMLSGIADPAFMQGALWAGIAHYLLKPCRLRDLEAAVFELAQSAGRSSLAADAAMRIEKRGR